MRLDFESILGLLFFVVFIVLPLVNRGKKNTQGQQPGRPVQPGAPTAPGGQVGRAGGSQTQGQPRTVISHSAPRHPTATINPPPSSSTPPDGLMGAIEEIRRRVAEAQAREDGARTARTSSAQPSMTTSAPTQSAGMPSGAQSPQRTLVGSDPFGTPLVSSAPVTLSGSPVHHGSGSGHASVPTAARRPPPPALGREGAPSDTPRVQRLSVVAPTVRPTRAAGAEAAIRRRDSGRAAAPIVARGAAGALMAVDRDSVMRGLIWHEILSDPLVLRHRRRKR